MFVPEQHIFTFQIFIYLTELLTDSTSQCFHRKVYFIIQITICKHKFTYSDNYNCSAITLQMQTILFSYKDEGVS